MRQFFRNAEGIWVVGSQGLILVDAQSEQVIRRIGLAEGLPWRDLNHLYEDGEGNLWIGSVGGGLIFWDRKRDVFEPYTTEQGLSSNVVYAVYEDDFQTLWLPSDYGLMAFDKGSRDVRTYHLENGIAHEEFNTFSHHRDADGTLHFGGLGGLTSFHPREMQGDGEEKAPPIMLSEVRALREGEEYFEDRTRSFKSEHAIVVSPQDMALELGVSFLDFKNTRRNRLSYRIPGHQEGWIYPKGNGIVLRNLPYGSWELQVRARGASGAWSKDPLTVPLEVLRPFYLKPWFLFLALALVVAGIWGAVRLRLRALRRDQQRLVLEVKKRTATIARQAEELREIDQIKSQFFANITHEFRTPLTLVIGPAEQLIEEDPPPRIRKGLSGILQNARNLLHLINQLLDISKLEHGQMRVEGRSVDVVALTRRMACHFEPLAIEKDLRLFLDIQLEGWWIELDTGKWRKIIYNLLSNAIKFTPEGGSILLRLRRSGEEGARKLVLEVRDSGIGLHEEDLERVFDRFYQVNSSSTRDQGGTGIGLSLVRELVELQRGVIRVASEVGRGTRFEVEIPVVDAKAGEGGEPVVESQEGDMAFSAEEKEENGEKDGEMLDLLLIEDHPELRAYIRSCIDTRRYRVTEAADGAEGLRLALEMVPDLVISDVMMPGMDGFEVTQAIRAHIATSHIPLILLTAKATHESRLEGLRRGADAYLTKPFSPAELNLRIDKLIEVRRQLQERFRPSRSLADVGRVLAPPPPTFEEEDRFMKKLRDFIGANLDDPELKLPKIISYFGMSKTQFYRKLKSLTDMGVSDLVRSARCDHALELIRAGHLSMKEIAYASGFSSPSNFSRSFRQQFGISPTEVLPTPRPNPSSN